MRNKVHFLKAQLFLPEKTLINFKRQTLNDISDERLFNDKERKLITDTDLLFAANSFASMKFSLQ